MTNYNLAVICPGQNTPVTPAEIKISEQKINQAVSEMKAAGYVPQKTDIDMQIGLAGVATPTMRTKLPIVNKLPYIGESKFEIDPLVMACMSEKQDMATLLHETGHLHEPVITSLVIIASAIAISSFINLIGKLSEITTNIWHETSLASKGSSTNNKIKIPNMAKAGASSIANEFKENWPSLLGSATRWTLSGLVVIYSQRINETYADLYAAWKMQTPNYMQSFLSVIDNEQFLLADPQKYKEAPHYSASAKLNNYIFYGVKISIGGPFGLLLDTHPTAADRKALLESDRQAIEAHKPARTSLDVLKNYSSVLSISL